MHAVVVERGSGPAGTATSENKSNGRLLGVLLLGGGERATSDTQREYPKDGGKSK